MASPTHPHYSPPGSQQGGLGVWYRSIIVVVAVVLAGLPWCRTGQSGYVADGTAIITSDSAEPEAHAHLQPMLDEILKQTTADGAFANYLEQHPELKQELGAKTNRDAIELFRRRLEVDPNRVGGKVTIQLRFYAASRQICTDVMSRFLVQFQNKFDHWKQDKASMIASTYSQELEVTQAKLKKVDDELQRYQAVTNDPPARLPSTATERQASPEWTKLSDDLRTAKTTLQQLLITRTESHPLVVDQKDKITALEASLASTPKYPSNEDLIPKTARENTGALAAQQQFKIDELQKEKQEAESRLTMLTHRKHDADRALGFVRGIHMEVPGDQVQVASVGGIWKMGALMVLGGWVIFFGLIAFQLAWSASRPAPLRSVGKLASASSVPVVATMSLPSSSPRMPSGSSLVGPMSFLMTRAAELTVIGILAMVLLATRMHPEIGDLLHDDPLGVVRESLRVLFPSSQ